MGQGRESTAMSSDGRTVGRSDGDAVAAVAVVAAAVAAVAAVDAATTAT